MLYIYTIYAITEQLQAAMCSYGTELSVSLYTVEPRLALLDQTSGLALLFQPGVISFLHMYTNNMMCSFISGSLRQQVSDWLS